MSSRLDCTLARGFHEKASGSRPITAGTAFAVAPAGTEINKEATVSGAKALRVKRLRCTLRRRHVSGTKNRIALDAILGQERRMGQPSKIPFLVRSTS
jgi:hypothetical protein